MPAVGNLTENRIHGSGKTVEKLLPRGVLREKMTPCGSHVVGSYIVEFKRMDIGVAVNGKSGAGQKPKSRARRSEAERKAGGADPLPVSQGAESPPD